MSYFEYKNLNIYYRVFGEGKPLVIIHGDTASSKMFIPELKFYSKNFKVILLDLVGQGKSQRVDKLPLNYWHFNSILVIELCKYLGISNVNLLGTSGGAIVALNAVLEEPNLFNKIIVDSFIGENLSYDFAKKIVDDRKIAKSMLGSKLFWFIMHGFDWKNVIDQNTNLIINFSRNISNFFNYNLSNIENNVLITGSLKDDLIPNIESTLKSINLKIENSKLVIFENGNHPAMFSNKEEFRNLVLEFLS
ncbi:alpha/beta fold hydrolase [Crassaminicella profunda]|uniref:alpha/beta fold hydrolase n=1 Tax=Crassaminicella profunda TaxID=1286698 RepID=UPI001CA62CF3|nr:alpha/beta hydrolase [Crassaminicella profunda]QZY56483.1 alpha/beta hydrolase [Crassaminicella profunda]